MKFSTREDISASVDAVFDMLCDFGRYERAAMRRGAEVSRRSEPEKPGIGTTWDVRFFLRGKERNVVLAIVKLDRPDHMVVAMSAKGFSGTVEFDLMALSRTKTRLVVGFEVTPQTLTARLLLQSLKLTKSTLDQKYKMRVSNYVTEMRERLSDKA